MQEITVVIMTRDRVDELVTTLGLLRQLPEQPAIVVVDNASQDGTVDAVRAGHPGVEVIALPHNAGVGARNLAVASVRTPYIAFSDDDSWWAPGSLARAVELFRDNPRIGALAAEVRVEPGARPDPINAEMRHSPLTRDRDLPGVPVLGFLACSAVVRRTAFLDVGGFSERLHFGGEEELFCTDLATKGWAVQYTPELTAHHHPSLRRDNPWRLRRGIRNRLWYLWLRRPWRTALERSVTLLRGADRRAAAAGLLAALGGLPWVLRERRVVPPHVEEQIRLLEPDQDTSSARQYAS